jgi:serine/threonine-protein kinase
MGSVWLADHLGLEAQVVVKFMATELLAHPEFVSRFRREATAASQVRSPHVVQVLDHGVTPEGVPYIVMEYLEGRDLESRISQRGPLSVDELELVVTHVSRALARAHEKGIVHRDIKPANIFLCDQGGDEPFVKLLDFGIAKGVELIGPGTRTGALIGSPRYMSPEQLVGAKTLDHRTDLWSLAIVAFEALTTQAPFVAETLGAITLLVHAENRPSLTKLRPDLPASFDAWFVRATASDPNARFASAKDLRDAFAAAAAEARAMPHGAEEPASPGAAAPAALGRPFTAAGIWGPQNGTGSSLQATVAPTRAQGKSSSLVWGFAAGVISVALAIAALAIVRRSPAGSAAAEAGGGGAPDVALAGPSSPPDTTPSAAASSAPEVGPAAPQAAPSAPAPSAPRRVPAKPAPAPPARPPQGKHNAPIL